jgi:hypothetical protein
LSIEDLICNLRCAVVDSGGVAWEAFGCEPEVTLEEGLLELLLQRRVAAG